MGGLCLWSFGAPIAQEKKAEQPAPSVIIIEAAEQEVTAVRKYPGRAEAVDTVDLRARVAGFLEKRNFREGADVAKGELLFVIEQEPYKNCCRPAPRRTPPPDG